MTTKLEGGGGKSLSSPTTKGGNFFAASLRLVISDSFYRTLQGLNFARMVVCVWMCRGLGYVRETVKKIY